MAHGRGIWIMDDITPLVELAERMDSAVHLFDIRPATSFRIHQHANFTGHKAFVSPNPPLGASINFWVKGKPGEKDRLSITISDSSGKVVRDLRGLRAQPGLNRVAWDLRENSPLLGFAGAPLAEDPDPLSSTIMSLAMRINSYTAAPTAGDLAMMDRLSKKVDAVVEEANALEKEVPALNKLLFDNGIGKLDTSAARRPPSEPRP